MNSYDHELNASKGWFSPYALDKTAEGITLRLCLSPNVSRPEGGGLILCGAHSSQFTTSSELSTPSLP